MDRNCPHHQDGHCTLGLFGGKPLVGHCLYVCTRPIGAPGDVQKPCGCCDPVNTKAPEPPAPGAGVRWAPPTPQDRTQTPQ